MPTHFPTQIPLDRREIGVLALGATAALGIVWYAFFRPRPDPNETERRRRLYLAANGRITDATLIDGSLGEGSFSLQPEREQHVLLYFYRVSGVTYESAQDVSLLEEQVRDLRVDLPVQVRYDPRNPTNSIVVAESWSGLRLNHRHASGMGAQAGEPQ